MRHMNHKSGGGAMRGPNQTGTGAKWGRRCGLIRRDSLTCGAFVGAGLRAGDVWRVRVAGSQNPA